jgi:hypothetical protein
MAAKRPIRIIRAKWQINSKLGRASQLPDSFMPQIVDEFRRMLKLKSIELANGTGLRQ